MVSLKEMQLLCVQKVDGRRMTPIERSRYSYTRVITPDHPATVPRMSEMEMAQLSLEKEEHKFIAILTPYDARDSGEPMQDADPLVSKLYRRECNTNLILSFKQTAEARVYNVSVFTGLRTVYFLCERGKKWKRGGGESWRSGHSQL